MPGAGYTASGIQTTASTADSALTIAEGATTLHRVWITEFLIADIGTPADNVFIWTVQRATADGDGTAVTPTRLDLADAEALSVCVENHTTEPTYTSTEELFEFGLNARATFRWVASPGMEIIIPATANVGVGFWTDHASATTDHRATAAWLE